MLLLLLLLLLSLSLSLSLTHTHTHTALSLSLSLSLSLFALSGVSILVGRLEQPPYEEQVIQMMWDVEEWTEEVASNWWKENSYRYHGAASADSGKLIVTSGYTSGR